jgi:Zn-dependent peptidase ImmA (M78 family)
MSIELYKLFEFVNYLNYEKFWRNRQMIMRTGGKVLNHLSRKDIEAIAARITSSYEHLPRFAGQEVSHIDPQILACELCGLTLDHCRISRSGDTLGLTAYSEIGVIVYNDDWHPFVYYLDGNTILVETALKNDPAQRGRYHFTVMHEAAHQILAQMDTVPQNTVHKRVIYYRGGTQRFPIQDWGEWQADNLASALLLPVNLVQSALARFDFPNGIEMLNRVFRAQAYSRFSEMAEYLGVSKQALAIRLKRLGLLKQDYLHNPYALVNIEMEDFE